MTDLLLCTLKKMPKINYCKFFVVVVFAAIVSRSGLSYSRTKENENEVKSIKTQKSFKFQPKQVLAFSWSPWWAG